MVKGVFYGAHIARSLDEAVAVFRQTVAKWGVPVIIQKFHAGEEYDVVAVGDGAGAASHGGPPGRRGGAVRRRPGGPGPRPALVHRVRLLHGELAASR